MTRRRMHGRGGPTRRLVVLGLAVVFAFTIIAAPAIARPPESALWHSNIDQNAEAPIGDEMGWGEVDKIAVDTEPGDSDLPTILRWLIPGFVSRLSTMIAPRVSGYGANHEQCTDRSTTPY